jgi:uncharacterized protein (TIGR00266 family)
MHCHDINFQIIGHDIQMVEIELDPQESVIAEAGAMTYMEEDIDYETKLGDGSDPDQGFLGKLFSAGKRAITGESVFLTHFTNVGHRVKHVGFSAPYPGKIVALNLAETNNEILCQKDAFLCAALGTQISVAFTKKLGAGFFGGEGFILQKLVGDGMAFVHAGGTIIKKELHNETLRIDTGCIVAFASTLDYSIELSGGLKSMVFGGEGIFVATVSGTGTVYLQSMPFSRLANTIIAKIPHDNNSN